jgi:hypothetical protein
MYCWFPLPLIYIEEGESPSLTHSYSFICRDVLKIIPPVILSLLDFILYLISLSLSLLDFLFYLICLSLFKSLEFLEIHEAS